MLWKILIALGVALAALLAYATTRPDSFRIERKALIQAPPDKVYAHIEDLRRFNAWNPYERKDPGKGQYGNPSRTTGPGASYAWASDKLGEGRMEIVETTPTSRVLMRLDFIKPMKTSSTAEFTVRPAAGGGSEVAWAMSGPSPYISKLMGVIFDMDKMLGRDFEDGLANLKTLAEQKG